MEVLWIWFGLLGAVTVLAAGCALCVWLERKLPVKRFDERQQEARGKGYRFGFWVSITYYLILLVAVESADIGAKEIAVWVFAGVMLQFLATEIYALMTGAMLPFAQKSTVFLFALYLLMGVMWLCMAFSSVEKEQALFGQYSIPWSKLIFSVMFFSFGVMYLIDWVKRRRSDNE